ncbi:hypothetical protein J5N97_026032 [Dioscorea zingiberensis]|uniref:Uncharacterized protein n=1 Tax=Dioscorea zingiberensis TaxID=325984 RepID=A0A9D5H649_9LILI|nr:hypothetical protein J5N97_026032 [Dioscorea zingiberensis]
MIVCWEEGGKFSEYGLERGYMVLWKVTQRLVLLLSGLNNYELVIWGDEMLRPKLSAQSSKQVSIQDEMKRIRRSLDKLMLQSVKDQRREN